MTLLFKCYEMFCNTFLCAFLITLCSPQQGLMNSTHFCLVVKIIHKPFSELNFKNYRLRTVTYTGNIWQIKVQYRHSSQELKHKKQSWDYMCYCRTVLLNQVHSLFYLFVFFTMKWLHNITVKTLIHWSIQNQCSVEPSTTWTASSTPARCDRSVNNNNK